MPIALGPFVLQRPLARGGMAEVWRAVHQDQGLPVAIKVMSPPSTGKAEAFHASFRVEVRAAAALAHPNIVPIYDFGVIPADAASRTAGRLPAGSPYLVMELAPHGSLSRRRGKLRWPSLARTLHGLLAAMAHAHAHGLVHRDLKPGNLLLYDGDQVKLTDFGLAHLGGEDGGSAGGGTPTYMAPEQFTHDWREFGPWTDLYGLGCLAWVLATGEAPFGTGADGVRTMHAHLTLDPVPFRPRVAVPEGFEDWLRALLRKNPMDRTQRAADAAYALASLVAPIADDGDDDEEDVEARPDEPTRLRAPPLANQDTLLRDTSGSPTGPPGFPSLAPPPPRTPHEPARPPPLPPLGHLPPTPGLPWIAGIGPRLFGIRQIPLVGRRDERVALWAALAEVHAEGSARVVVVGGPAGCGKTRLAQWLAESADEVGGAQVMRVTHSDPPGPTDGVRGMLGRDLGCVGLDTDQVLERIGARVAASPEVRGALASALDPDPGPGAAPLREREAAVVRHVEQRSRQRPVLLWIDDAQLGGEALALVERLLERQAFRKVPVLALILAQDEGLAERPAEAAAIERLAARPTARRLRVGPFPREGWRELVRELLPLEPELAARVEEKTAGHPLFLVQLLQDWAARKLLVPAERGWALAEGTELALPADLHGFWTPRLDRLLEHRPASWAVALEVAAVLGADVALDDWRTAVSLLGHEAPEELIDELAAARLADPWPQRAGFSFPHTPVREALLGRADRAGRRIAAHRACARMLEGRETPEEIGRRARHRATAGELEEADRDFHRAVISGRGRDYRWTVDLVSAWERALPADPARMDEATARRRCEGWVAGLRAARLCGRSRDGGRWRLLALATAERHRWVDLQAELLYQQAAVAEDQGRTEEARVGYELAMAAAARAGDTPLRLSALLASALATLSLGNLPRARALLEETLAAARAEGLVLLEARSLVSLGSVRLLEGHGQEALARMEEALPRLEAGATRWDQAQAHNHLAEAWRSLGDLDRAELHYRRALAIYRDLASWTGAIVELNLALVGFQRGRFGPVEADLQRILAFALQDRRPQVEVGARVCLLRCAAALGRWEAVEEHTTALVERLAETRAVHADIAQQAHAAGEAALAAGQSHRARRALEVALDQYVALGRSADRDRVGELLASVARRRATAGGQVTTPDLSEDG